MTRKRLHTDSEVCMYALTVSIIELKNIKKAMTDHSWIEFMQDELNQFERLQVWELVLPPEGKNIIALKWLWKNKQEEGIDFEESFAPVARLEAVRQPEGFIDPEFPDHVYRLKKALYGLKQAPRACQSQYAIELLKKHGIDECISMNTPMEIKRLDADLQGTPTDQITYRHMTGGLMYLIASCPDIAFATFVCARYQARPTIKHLKEVKRIFRYLRQSYNMGLWRIAISRWKALIWMRIQLLDYGYKYNQIPMYCDSKSAIAISCNPVHHSKTKHIDIRYHFIKEHVEKGTVELYFVGTEYQLANLFTKALPKERFEYLVHRIVIIMAQQQHAADVHPDELCPPNKRYDLMDANKKVDLKQVQFPPESKILKNIIKNHPLRFSIAASSSVPWIYMVQFWHTLKEDRSKYRLTFMLDKKVLSLTLDDFRTIFHLPQANANNINSFMPPPLFLDMPWQTLCKIFSKCLTTCVIGRDQPSLQIMQMMYWFVNNIHVDYAELLWEGLYYSLHHPTYSIPYPRFTKIIISHYMTCFPDISRRARDMYHNLQDDDIMKNIFNSGRHKDKVGMQIPDWMITEEMKHTEHYRMYAEVFGLDVPLTQSQPTESTQGTHRTPSAPRRSTRLTPPAPVPTVDKEDEMILQDTLQVSLAKHKIQEEQEARENVKLVNKHLASKEIEKMMEGSENVIDDSLPPKNDEPNIPGTRLEPRSDKESPEVEITNDEEVEITNVVIPVNVNEEEEEITDEVFLSRKSFDTLADHLQEVMVESLPIMVDTHIKKQVPEQVRDQVPVYVAEGLILDRHKTKEEMKRMIAKAILQERGNIQAEISLQIHKSIDNHIPSQVDASVRSYMSGNILHVHPAQSQTLSVPEQQYQLYLSMKNDPQLQQQDIAICLALQMKFENLQNRAKRQKNSEYEAYVFGESSSGQVNENEQGLSTLGNQEQEDEYDF
ncbi:hypothetical protein Tco_0835913 [Tanacetum coccineum]